MNRATRTAPTGPSLYARQQLGEMQHARPQPATLDALLELPVAAGVDHSDHVEVSACDLVEMPVEHARAVLGSHDRVRARPAAADRGARQLDVLADAGDQLARLAPDAQPVAQVTRVLQSDPRAAISRGRRSRAVAREQPLRELLDALGSEHARQVRGAPAGSRHDRPGKRLAELLGQLLAARELSVVRV